MSKSLVEQRSATKHKMKEEWAKSKDDDGCCTQGGSFCWPPWVVQMICELLINGTVATAVPSTIQRIYEMLYYEPPKELPSVDFVCE